jgi:hypothetical protein
MLQFLAIELNEFCVDVCLRNAQGQFIKAVNRWFDGILPAIANAIGLEKL